MFCVITTTVHIKWLPSGLTTRLLALLFKSFRYQDARLSELTWSRRSLDLFNTEQKLHERKWQKVAAMVVSGFCWQNRSNMGEKNNQSFYVYLMNFQCLNVKYCKQEACWYVSDLAIGDIFSFFDPKIVLLSSVSKPILLYLISLHCNAQESSTMSLLSNIRKQWSIIELKLFDPSHIIKYNASVLGYLKTF